MLALGKRQVTEKAKPLQPAPSFLVVAGGSGGGGVLPCCPAHSVPTDPEDLNAWPIQTPAHNLTTSTLPGQFHKTTGLTYLPPA